jgi:hypothetical protein
MAKRSTITWKPGETVVLNNVSNENLLLELASGYQRLDAGRSVRITASALDQPKVWALLDAGKIQLESTRGKL